jgi:hypothetical protein
LEVQYCVDVGVQFGASTGYKLPLHHIIILHFRISSAPPEYYRYNVSSPPPQAQHALSTVP